jgi:hypothetical protein
MKNYIDARLMKIRSPVVCPRNSFSLRDLSDLCLSAVNFPANTAHRKDAENAHSYFPDRRLVSIVLGAVLLALSFPAERAAHAQHAQRTLESLNWLAGCWQTVGGRSQIVEQWMQPAGGMMLGINRTVKDGRAVEYEFLRINEENGTLVYTAIPSGQEKASFTLAGGATGEFIFENKDHDYPQRVIYKSLDGALLASIDGSMNGKSRRIDFPMQRVPCAGTATK